MTDKCTKCLSNKLCGECYTLAYEKLLEWLDSKEFIKEYIDGKRDSS